MENGNPQIPEAAVEPDVGDTRANRPGRPSTGRTTVSLTIRLPKEIYQELVRRADNRGYPPFNWAAQIIRRELRRRPGEATRARAREQASS